MNALRKSILLGALALATVLAFVPSHPAPGQAYESGYNTTVSSTAAEASHVIKAGEATLVALIVHNNKSSAQFIQVHNAASLPADAAVPVISQIVAANSNYTLILPMPWQRYGTGIVVCNSSTLATKTIGSADCFFTAIIK